MILTLNYAYLHKKLEPRSVTDVLTWCPPIQLCVKIETGTAHLFNRAAPLIFCGRQLRMLQRGDAD